MNKLAENEYIPKTAEFALERVVPESDARLTVGCVVALHGFNMNLTGTRCIMSLLYDYLYKSDFILQDEVNALAEEDNTDIGYVYSCILASIRYNRKFNAKASSLLERPIKLLKPDITEVLKIMSASYKIYYNYVIDSINMIDDIKGADNE